MPRLALQQAEDQIKLQIRLGVRNLQQQYELYEIQKNQYVVNLIQQDQTFQNYLAPPAPGGGGAAAGGQQVLLLVNALNGVNSLQNQLISTWVSYETFRLALYRDLGIMPYDEWEAFYELFPAASPAASGPDGTGTGPSPAAATWPIPLVEPDAGPEAEGLGG